MSDSATIHRDEWLHGKQSSFRLLDLNDCTNEYVGWLCDPTVNRHLETRWSEQNLETVRQFVKATVEDPASFLFGIFAQPDLRHIGNIKIGPVNRHHLFADVSYFVGARDMWGKGMATDAVKTITTFGFNRIGLHRAQASLYASNLGSAKVLLRAGYREEGTRRLAARSGSGWEDILQFGVLKNEWTA